MPKWILKHAICVDYLKSQNGFGMLIKQCLIERSGASMPKEPKITKMDWRSLGYWPVYKDGKKVWEKDKNRNNSS